MSPKARPSDPFRRSTARKPDAFANAELCKKRITSLLFPNQRELRAHICFELTAVRFVYLPQIDGLEKLTRLRKLELGKNRITSCEKLGRLTGLTQLSLEVGPDPFLQLNTTKKDRRLEEGTQWGVSGFHRLKGLGFTVLGF
jgi:hypothetical protein